MKILSKSLLALVAYLSIGYASLSGQRYEVGDIVENFTLTEWKTGRQVSLEDFEGKVVLLEWFAWWCPFCQSAAQDISDRVVSRFETTGNENGVPFLHVAVNLDRNVASTDNFIRRFNLGTVVEDFDRDLADRFQSGGQPIFAIINGLENSASHQQWELLYSHLGFGSSVTPTGDMINRINSVMPAPPPAPTITEITQATRIASGETLSLNVVAESSVSIAYQWNKDGQAISGATAATFALPNAIASNTGTYTVTVSNEGGSVTSDPIRVNVITNPTDYLAGFTLPANEDGPTDDPDQDGIPNLKEYLFGTDPTRPDSLEAHSQYSLSLDPQTGAATHILVLKHRTDIIGVDITAAFAANPDFASNVSAGTVNASDSQGTTTRTYTRTVDPDSRFARLQAELQP